MNLSKVLNAGSPMVLLFAALSVGLSAYAQAPLVTAKTLKVTTVAGGYKGNGKPVNSAGVAGPESVAVDAKGNIYFSDSENCQIRKINKQGIVTVFAGTGLCGYSGDGGPAKSATLSAPAGIAFDAEGSLLIADDGNSRIRKVTAGIITTVAGNGSYGYSGDGGPAINASLAYPVGVCSDSSGNVYVADTSNSVIRLIDSAGIIHTVAGNGTAGFSGDGGPATSAQLNFPYSVLVDSIGDFYVADGSNNRVRKVDASGIITTYAGNGLYQIAGDGGPATSASLPHPEGLLLASGKLYISTATNIWDVDTSTQIITLITGNANTLGGFNGDGIAALTASLNFPWGMAFDSAGDLLVADQENNRLRKIDTNQMITTIVGSYIGDGGPARKATLNPAYLGEHLSFDPAGNLYIADTNNNRIRKVSTDGTIATVAGTGITGYSGDGGPATAATLNTPSGVAADAFGNVYIADTYNGVIREVDSSGTITTIAMPVGFINGYGMAVDHAGNLYVAGSFTAAVWKITPTGDASIVAGELFQFGYNGDGIPATQALLQYPIGVAVDDAGDIYIADWEGYRIRKVDTNGIISTVAGNGIPGSSGDGGPATAASASPLDVAVDAKGNLYIADTEDLRIRIVNSSGIIQTFAGSGMNFGYNGNGLPALDTSVYPIAVSVNPKGKVYFSDLASRRVRKIH
jgi:sugar lactone lactonase YvrE